MKKTLSIEAVHPLYAGELGHALSQMASQAERFKAQDDYESDGENTGNKPYTVIDGIAIYKISGPLLTNGSWMSRMFGYAAYDDIRADLMQAASDPEVVDILLYMGTPGGSVFGVTDASDALTKIGAIKNLYVYSSKNVASGGYWLAANAGTLIASPESEWGSVGVIVTHCSYEKQLEEEGVKVTVIKSAELKAVGGPYKDLTDKEVSHIQAQVDQYNDLFQEHVRSKRPGVRLASMKGETYIGSEALRMGLVDAVMSYDQTIDYIKSKRKVSTQTGGYRMKMTAEELKVALEAGATLDSLGLSAEEAELIKGVEVETVEAVEPEAKQEESLDVGAMQEQILMLTAKVTEQEGALAAAQELAARLETDGKMVAEMKSIISDIMNNRRVALSLTKMDFTAFSAESLITDYKAISDQFDKAFKTGGLFAKKEEVAKPQVAIDRVHAGMLDAAA